MQRTIKFRSEPIAGPLLLCSDILLSKGYARLAFAAAFVRLDTFFAAVGPFDETVAELFAGAASIADQL